MIELLSKITSKNELEIYAKEEMHDQNIQKIELRGICEPSEQNRSTIKKIRTVLLKHYNL